MNTDTTPVKTGRLNLACPWLKRVGIAGFLFFLIKGLLWLFVPGVLVFFGLSG